MGNCSGKRKKNLVQGPTIERLIQEFQDSFPESEIDGHDTTAVLITFNALSSPPKSALQEQVRECFGPLVSFVTTEKGESVPQIAFKVTESCDLHSRLEEALDAFAACNSATPFATFEFKFGVNISVSPHDVLPLNVNHWASNGEALPSGRLQPAAEEGDMYVACNNKSYWWTLSGTTFKKRIVESESQDRLMWVPELGTSRKGSEDSVPIRKIEFIISKEDDEYDCYLRRTISR